MAIIVLDLLFAWAQQQPLLEQEKLSVKVSGISSVSVFPAASGYGMGTLMYTPGQWRKISPAGEIPFWVDFPAGFQGTIKMPKFEQDEAGRPTGTFTAVEIPMVITGTPINLFPRQDTYYVTFNEPPLNFIAVGSATNASPGPPVSPGDVNGSVTCTDSGDAFAFEFEAQP